MVLEKHETISHSTIVSFVLEDKDSKRYYIAYSTGDIAENRKILTYLLKIIPGDTVTFSADTQLLKLQEDTKWKS